MCLSLNPFVLSITASSSQRSDSTTFEKGGISKESRGAKRGNTNFAQLSSSASRLTVRTALPSLSASTAFFSSSLLLRSPSAGAPFFLPKARGAEYAHVPGTIDELTATNTSSLAPDLTFSSSSYSRSLRISIRFFARVFTNIMIQKFYKFYHFFYRESENTSNRNNDLRLAFVIAIKMIRF